MLRGRRRGCGSWAGACCRAGVCLGSGQGSSHRGRLPSAGPTVRATGGMEPLSIFLGLQTLQQEPPCPAAGGAGCAEGSSRPRGCPTWPLRAIPYPKHPRFSPAWGLGSADAPEQQISLGAGEERTDFARLPELWCGPRSAGLGVSPPFGM